MTESPNPAKNSSTSRRSAPPPLTTATGLVQPDRVEHLVMDQPGGHQALRGEQAAHLASLAFSHGDHPRPTSWAQAAILALSPVASPSLAATPSWNFSHTRGTAKNRVGRPP